MPRFDSFDDLNARLEEQCLKRQDEVLRGHSETIGERLMRDLDALMTLPLTPYDACEKVSTRATSISMVRYRNNDYSVPVAYAHHEVQVRGYVHEVIIGCGTEIIACHKRSYEKADMVFDPMHFLPLLEQKVGALDQAAPLQGWDLPGEFATLHRLLEARMGKKGKREYVQVLRLLESFGMGACPRGYQTVAGTGRDRLRCGQASGALPDRETPAPARSRYLPLPAQSTGRDHQARELYEPDDAGAGMTDTPQVLLQHHLKKLRLPTFPGEYSRLAQQCAAEKKDHVQYLLRLCELELIERERRMIERSIKAAKFPATKSLDSFDFKAIPSLNKPLVLELARCEYIDKYQNIIALGPSGTGKTHVALGLGLAACQKGLKVRFITAASLVHELIEAVDERRLQRFQKQLTSQNLLIIDELGFVPLSKTGAELLFEVISQRYERGSIIITSNLPFDEWTEIFGTERLTGALLDRLTHHVHILEMNGDSFRLKQSRNARA